MRDEADGTIYKNEAVPYYHPLPAEKGDIVI